MAGKAVEELTIRRGQTIVLKGNATGYKLKVLATESGRCKVRPMTGLDEPLYLRPVGDDGLLYLTDGA